MRAAFALALVACSSPGAIVDGGARDLAVTDGARADFANADFAGGIPLQEGPCPQTLQNPFCFYPPGVDLGFF